MTMLANRTETRALTLADYEARIHLYKEQIGTGYIGIGRTLLEAKEAKVVPHGQWESWVQETTGLTPRQAQRCMQAAEEIKDGSALARLEMSKALMLLGSGLDEEAREEIAARAADEGATVKQLREELKKAKLQVVQETGVAAEIREALKRAKGEKESLEGQMRATVEAYQKRMDQAEEDAYRRGMKDTEQKARDEIQKEYQGKINCINSERKIAEERMKELKAQLEEAERNRSARWDDGYKTGVAYGEQQRNQQIRKLEEEAENLRKKLEEKQAAAVPADFAKDRELLLAAAEEAERRAADAEAELEALKAGNGEDRGTVADKINSAVFQFLSVCGYMTDRPEVLQRVDAQGARNILCGVDILQGWCVEVYKVLDGTVEAEGAVE